MPGFQSATVISNVNEASTFYHVTFEVDGMETFDFKPGQFIALKVDPKKVNDYSIASLPHGNKFELIVDVKPGHEGSYYIHDLRPGDKVQFMGPVGSFFFHEDDGAEEFVMLATGSGVAPIKSLVEERLYLKHDTRKIRMFFGLRNCSDIFMHEYFADMMVRFPNFVFTPCLSRPGEFWRGDCGHITDLFKENYSDGSKMALYMCGNRLMIEGAKEHALAIGLPSNRIYHEAF